MSEQTKLVTDALIQARGALLLDCMVDESGQLYGTTQVALEELDKAIAALRAAASFEPKLEGLDLIRAIRSKCPSDTDAED